VVKVDRRIRWHYTTTILRLRIGARLTRYRNCKFHNFASIISRHADGISRYSVPPSAGPLLPLHTQTHTHTHTHTLPAQFYPCTHRHTHTHTAGPILPLLPITKHCERPPQGVVYQEIYRPCAVSDGVMRLTSNAAILIFIAHHNVDCRTQAYNGTFAKWLWSASPSLTLRPPPWSESLGGSKCKKGQRRDRRLIKCLLTATQLYDTFIGHRVSVTTILRTDWLQRN